MNNLTFDNVTIPNKTIRLNSSARMSIHNLLVLLFILAIQRKCGGYLPLKNKERK
jgi:hypothetical protein